MAEKKEEKKAAVPATSLRPEISLRERKQAGKGILTKPTMITSYTLQPSPTQG